MPPSSSATLVLDAPAIDRALRRVAHEIIERNPALDQTVLVGIPSRGVHLARRLADCIGQFEKVRPEVGVLDVSMHRDDLSMRDAVAPVETSRLPLDLDKRTVVLVDDVFFSGRTCRAAMDALSSFGRPARIQLAVLVDRGHRELPIRPDYVGKNIPTALTQRVYVCLQEMDGVPDSVWLEK